MNVPFPKGFIWGVSTSAYQIEGATKEDGRGPSIWDTFARISGAVFHGDTAEIACDHYHRLDCDLDLMAQLGIKAYRFSVAWPRVQPDGRTVNPLGLDFYDRLVDGLVARGIAPVATLYHWDLPQALQDEGGWTNRATADRFGDYTSVVVRRLGDRVGRWITLNEPWVAAFVGHLEGRHAPGMTDEASALQAAHHLLLAHARAMERIRAAAPRAKAGITLNLSDVLPATGSEPNIAAAARVDLFENRLFLSPLFRGGYPEDANGFWAGLTDFDFVRGDDCQAISQPMDFLGVNFYEQHRVVAISVVMRSRDSLKVWSVGDETSSEKVLIERFFDGLDKFTPDLVSWNGAGFDLPVLHYRSLLHSVTAARYWETGDSDHSFRFSTVSYTHLTLPTICSV